MEYAEWQHVLGCMTGPCAWPEQQAASSADVELDSRFPCAGGRKWDPGPVTRGAGGACQVLHHLPGQLGCAKVATFAAASMTRGSRSAPHAYQSGVWRGGQARLNAQLPRVDSGVTFITSSCGALGVLHVHCSVRVHGKPVHTNGRGDQKMRQQGWFGQQQQLQQRSPSGCFPGASRPCWAKLLDWRQLVSSRLKGRQAVEHECSSISCYSRQRRRAETIAHGMRQSAGSSSGHCPLTARQCHQPTSFSSLFRWICTGFRN